MRNKNEKGEKSVAVGGAFFSDFYLPAVTTSAAIVT